MTHLSVDEVAVMQCAYDNVDPSYDHKDRLELAGIALLAYKFMPEPMTPAAINRSIHNRLCGDLDAGRHWYGCPFKESGPTDSTGRPLVPCASVLQFKGSDDKYVCYQVPGHNGLHSNGSVSWNPLANL